MTKGYGLGFMERVHPLTSDVTQYYLSKPSCLIGKSERERAWKQNACFQIISHKLQVESPEPKLAFNFPASVACGAYSAFGFLFV